MWERGSLTLHPLTADAVMRHYGPQFERNE
jgi:hypothetical protein